MEENKDLGYIYLLMNPSMSGVIKIGLTRRSPEERVIELSNATGIPTPFLLVYKELFRDCVSAEKQIHSILEERGERISSNREFFSTDISEAIRIIQQVKNETDHVKFVDNKEESRESDSDDSISKVYLKQGIMYLDGDGDYLQDYDKAIKYLEKAAEMGEAEACCQLGYLFIDISKENELKLDAKKAIRYFEKGRLLSGKYANYCNAGLATSYTAFNYEYHKVKNVSKNLANATKAWEWFFKGIDFNRDDYHVEFFIQDFINIFMNNYDLPESYKQSVETVAYPVIKQCRYSLYRDNLDMKDELLKGYLLEKFEICQLDRKVELIWIPTGDFFTEDEAVLYLEVLEGTLNVDDIISIQGYIPIYRTIHSIVLDGTVVHSLNTGEKGYIEVDSFLADFSGNQEEDLQIHVIGSRSLENSLSISHDIKDYQPINQTRSTRYKDNSYKKTGFISNLKKWFT